MGRSRSGTCPGGRSLPSWVPMARSSEGGNTVMNQIERLRSDLLGRFPDAAMEIDQPADHRGSWFLDVSREGGAPPIVVEWRPDRGFGVSTPGAGEFGTGPDEVYPNAKAAFDRIV